MSLEFSSAFEIPSNLDFNDLDLLVDGIQVFLSNQTGFLTSRAEARPLGVEITLGRFSEIPAGSRVEILLGQHAYFGQVGKHQLITPSITGNYGVAIHLLDQNWNRLADQAAQVFVLPHLGVSAIVEPPKAPAESPLTLQELEVRPTVESGLKLPRVLVEGILSPDISNDGVVEVIDFVIMLTSWAAAELYLKEPSAVPVGAVLPSTDLNRDGRVDLQDMSIFLAYWTGI